MPGYRGQNGRPHVPVALIIIRADQVSWSVATRKPPDAESFSTDVTVTVRHEPTGLTEDIVCDAVVCATGFDPLDIQQILGNLTNSVAYDAEGPQVARDYRLITTSPLARRREKSAKPMRAP